MSSEEPLVVVAVHMYEKENATAHRTINYELVHQEKPTPVLRRGQAFNVAVRFNREYVEETDIVRLLFSFGPNPNILRGTRSVNTVTNRDSYLTDLEAWGVRMIGVSGADLSVEVRSPADSPVGVWQLNVETTIVGRKKHPNTYSYEKDIYLLFNPWIKDDLVYLEDDKLLDEYVLNDVGKIWVGAWGSARGREWIFGQFDECVLPACQLLLERSGIKAVSRGDPVKMCRAISRIVNSNDEDNGVITGNWDGIYEGGTAPAAWTGSVPILEEYLKTEKSVKYGQCWVFAGVVTTVCRALGIPSRVVSNLVSAHDANASLSIDRYYNLDNEELMYDPHNLNGEDSIWNYHVWNDVWMARPDLPKGYGGWQAIDATPQEQSDNFFQCGPASVEAIRQGAVGFNYDVTFMLASVNADLMRWKEDPESDMGYSKIDCNKYHIGRMILTKAPWIFDPNGDKDREDITSLYKAEEGTEAERLTLYRAVRSTEVAKKFYSMPSGKGDVEFELFDLDRVNIGEPFAVTVNIKNTSSQPRTIQAILSAGSVYYIGIKAKLIKRASGEFVLQPNASEQLKLTVTVDDYLDKLVEYCIIKLSAIASVKETRQTWADEDDFQVLKPNITVKIEGEPVVGKPTTIMLSFKNPLKRTLTECRFNYAGPGLSKNKILTFRDVAPEEDVYVEHQLIPQKSGVQKVVATFTSKELTDITGCATVDVLDED